MPPEQTQPPTDQNLNGMTPDESAAALGFITTLGQQHMAAQNAQDPTQAPTSPETAPEGQPQAQPQEDLTPRIDDLQGQIDALKTDVQKAIKDEIGTVKDMIKTALEDDNAKD